MTLSPALEEKRERLLALLRDYGKVAVAFSAGVDSTVVAKAAALACGEDAVAVTAVSESLPYGELEAARQLAVQIGIRHEVIQTSELLNDEYRQNGADRCYHCKIELYTLMEKFLPKLGVDVILNGANVDDKGDYRPGMQAALEHRVRSPLLEVGCDKSDVRELARIWNLPIWDKPASPCLSSRIAYGVEVTPERLQRVDQAELWLKEELGLRELRVRHEAHDLARIEVAPALFERLSDDILRQRLIAEFQRLGFQYVTLDLQGFRSGSLNEVLPVESLTAPREP